MKAKFAHLNAHLDLRWKSDFQKDTIIENFKDRNWEPVDDEEGTILTQKMTGTFIGRVWEMRARSSTRRSDSGSRMTSNLL
jgi:hypothetical protein